MDKIKEILCNMTDGKKYHYSFIAGVFAAGGSFFGKLPSSLNAFFDITVSPDPFYLKSTLLNVLPLVLMVICNVLNWRYFLKALQTCEQTLTATVLSTASNYLFSFTLGALFYREPFTLPSTIGLLLILSGLWFLCEKRSTVKHKKNP